MKLHIVHYIVLKNDIRTWKMNAYAAALVKGEYRARSSKGASVIRMTRAPFLDIIMYISLVHMIASLQTQHTRTIRVPREADLSCEGEPPMSHWS